MVSYKARQALMLEASRAYIRERAEQSPLRATPNGHVTTIRPPDALPGQGTLSEGKDRGRMSPTGGPHKDSHSTAAPTP